MGSKSKIAKYIVPIIQSYIDDNEIKQYVEPFVGGANVIDKVKCEERYGYDKNKYLIALLKRVQEGGTLLEEVPRELYNEARTAYNAGDVTKFEDWMMGNIGFLASYNGRWFDGGYSKSGYVKDGRGGLKFRNYYLEAKNNILNQAANLAGIQFGVGDYHECSCYTGSVIYCDPPYLKTKQYSNSKQFDYDDFWNTMREWSKNNIVLISELNAPDDFEVIWEKEVSRSIEATDKGVATEKLFKYKESEDKE